MKLILEDKEFLEKADTKEYPKGIIKALCSKNKEVKVLAEKLLSILI